MEQRSASVLDDRYALHEVIGDGATATVWRATDTRLDRQVAIKVVREGALDATGRERARAESLALARFTHPHLVAVYDAHIADDAEEPSYLVLELVDGCSLRDLIADGPIPPPEVARIGAAVAGALVHLHEHGVVHRDVKPANVLLGPGGMVKLADLGIARFVDGASRLTGTGLLIGTPAYLAPEQVDGGAVTGATDVYALGLLLLEALTGERTYEGSGIESALARLHRDPEVPSTLSAPWRAALAAMLARAPADRVAAVALPARLADLERDAPLTPTAVMAAPLAGAGLATEAMAPTTALAAPRAPVGEGTHNPRRIAAFGAVAAAGLLVVALAATSGGTPKVPSPGPSPSTSVPVASAHPVIPAVVRSTAPTPSATHSAPAARPAPVKASHPKKGHGKKGHGGG